MTREFQFQDEEEITPTFDERGRKVETIQEPEQKDRVTQGIITRYNITDSRLAELREKFSGLTIASLNDKTGYANVSAAKSEMVKYRGAVEATRKELKADSLEYGRKVDAEAKRITAELLSIEEPLRIEKDRIDAEIQAEKDRKQQIINDRVTERVNLLDAVNARAAIHPMDLPGMPESDFQAHLQVATTRFNEEKRKADEAATELARLQAEEQARKAKEKAEAEQVAKEQAAERERLDGIAKAQKAAQDRIDAQLREIEAEKRKEADAKARAEENERIRVETEARVKLEVEAKAKADAEREKQEAVQRLEAASDKEKLNDFLSKIRSVTLPHVKSAKHQQILLAFTNAIVTLDKAISGR